MRLRNYALGEWVTGTGTAVDLVHAVTGETIGDATSGGLDFKAMAEYARNVGGPKLRAMTFHERARMLKAMALHLTERKDRLYALSAATGATKQDSWVDIDGGIGTFFVYASKGKKELPSSPFFVDGALEPLGKTGAFAGRHIAVPIEGVAVHINAFNFPVWGMLEKLATTILAGVPAIVKPATLTSFLTESVFRAMVDSQILPDGAIQLICGSAGNLLDHLDGQCAVAFTGSADTARMLRSTPAILDHNVRFNAEADSLNFSMLAPESVPGTEEFDLFIKEVVREQTFKAGQKCTAIRRTFVPEPLVEAAVAALKKRLDGMTMGDPNAEGVRMGPLAGRSQVKDVRANADKIGRATERIYGNPDEMRIVGADPQKGAFFPALLFYAKDPLHTAQPHDIEAFGPVNTVMPYRTIDEAIELARLGKGSLVGSLFTSDDAVARQVVLGVAAYHGRLLILNRESAKESTGHGAAMPHLVHGGPGRAGGGEELGGIRGVLHYMQRTALQGSPATLAAITGDAAGR